MDFLMPLLTYPDASPASAITRALDFAATLDGSVTTLTHQADIPPIANSISKTATAHPECGACRPSWASRFPSITAASR